MKSRLDRTHGDLQDFGDLSVFQVLVIGQDQGLSQGLGQLFDAPGDPFSALLLLQLGQRGGPLADQEVDQGSGVALPAVGRNAAIEADRRVTAGLPQASTAWWVAIE